jgi:hypothetical protein
MKTVFLIAMLLTAIACQSQPMLGKNRSDVISMANNPDNDFHQIKEAFTDNGNPYISAFRHNDLFGWVFDDGRVSKYVIVIDADELNDYIKLLDEKFIKIEEFRYKDYSTGFIIYWNITKDEKYYHITATY